MGVRKQRVPYLCYTKGHIWCVTQPGVLGLNAHSEQCACVNGTQARCYTQWGVRYPQERALPDVAWTMVSRGRTGGAGRTDTQEAEGMRYGGEAARARPKALVRTHDSGAFRRQGLEEVTCLGEMPRSLWDSAVVRSPGNTLEDVQDGLEG